MKEKETWVQSVGWDDPLEKEMAIHSSILTWKILWTEALAGLQSMGLQRLGHDRAQIRTDFTIKIGFYHLHIKQFLLDISQIINYLFFPQY